MIVVVAGCVRGPREEDHRRDSAWRWPWRWCQSNDKIDPKDDGVGL